jgi:hypothetical protein
LIGDPQIPSPRLVGLAQRIEARARELAGYPGFRGNDWSLHRLVRTLAMWSVTVDRMATSGPTSYLAAARQFPDHPEHNLVDKNPLASHRAHVDLVSFLTVGDMVGDDLAALLLERWGLLIPDVPWRGFMAEVDRRADAGERGAPVAPARYLDLILREARHRVVAHRARRHTVNFSWESDGTLQAILIATRGREHAIQILQEVNAQLRVPSRGVDDYLGLVEWVLTCAPTLSADQRKQVGRAFKLAGYDTYPAKRIIDEVLALVGVIEP